MTISSVSTSRRLSDFVGSAFAEFAVARDVGGDLDWLAVGERLKAGVESVGGPRELDVERAARKNAPSARRDSEPLASVYEIQARG